MLSFCTTIPLINQPSTIFYHEGMPSSMFLPPRNHLVTQTLSTSPIPHLILIFPPIIIIFFSVEKGFQITLISLISASQPTETEITSSAEILGYQVS